MKSVILVVLLSLSACSTDRSPQGDPLLPDLVPVPVSEFRTRLDTETGAPKVLFTGVVANAGSGAFLLDGQQVDDGWEVIQRVEYSESGEETNTTEAAVLFGGDGHEHWHIGRVVTYHLEAEVGEIPETYDQKVGFCFFDFEPMAEAPPGSSESQVHISDSCGGVADRSFQMGLSVGWVDSYPWFLDGQEIDLTGLEPGRYRIVATVDPQGWFVESDTSNNTVSTTFEFSFRESDGAPIVKAELGVRGGNYPPNH